MFIIRRDDSKKGLKWVEFSSATSPTNFQETVDDELEKSSNEYILSFDKYLVKIIRIWRLLFNKSR